MCAAADDKPPPSDAAQVVTLPCNEEYCYSLSQNGLLRHQVNRNPSQCTPAVGHAPFTAYLLELDQHYRSAPLVNRNKTQVRIGSRLLEAMIDTGASINVVPQTLLRTLDGEQLRNQRPARVKHCYLANNAIVTVQVMVDITVTIQDVTHPITFHVLPSGTELILGLEFLQRTQCIFDCMKKVMYIRAVNENETDARTRAIHGTPLRPTIASLSHVAIRTIIYEDELRLLTPQDWENQYAPPTTTEVDLYTEDHAPRGVLEARPAPLCALHMTEGRTPYPRPTRYTPLSWDLSKSQLDERQQEEVQALLARHRAAFAVGMTELGHCHLVEVELSLIEGAKPKQIKPYRESMEQQEIIRAQIDKWLDHDIIEPAESNWRHSLVLVRKPHTANQFRVCSDVRYINANTVSFHYPMPDLNKILEQIGSQPVKYYTKLDLGSAYHQLDMHPDARHITGFACSVGAYRYKRAMFGLKNLPGIFTKLMDEVLGTAQGKYVSAFIDDILVYSTTWADHLVHLDDVLHRLETAGLTASPSKTTIAVDSIQYIGHVVSTHGVTADGENVAKIRDCTSPTNLKECRQAIGLLSYYRRLIPCFAQLCKPLHDCTKKPSDSFEWTEEAETNFHTLKEKLITAPILGLPDFKSSHPFQLYCDASGTGCGYNLTQVQPDPVQPDSTGSPNAAPRMIERVLLYGGAAWTDVQKRYSTIELEMLAIIVAVRKLHPYLFNRMTILYTDCKSLKFVFHNTKVLNDKVLRWVLTLSQYRLLVIHIAGKENVTSDYLSRMPQGDVVSEEDVLRVPLYSLEEACMPTCDRATLESINVQQGKIEAFHADVLVNPTNCQLDPRGGADRALQYAGGPDLLDHCAEIGTCLEGGIVVTPGYQLPCRYVAHVVGPRAYQSISLLESCYEKALDAMLNLGCTSICFPCISCGVFGFDKTRAARMAVGTCIRWLQRHQGTVSITFMIYPTDHGSYQLYMSLLDQLRHPDPTTLPKLRTVAPSKLDLSTKLSVPIPAATLQELYTTECAENKKPVLINFGRMHELPPTATLQDAITWSADLEKDLVGTEPINDEISVIQDIALPRDPWKFDVKEVAREQRLDPEWAACISKLMNEDLPTDMSKNQLHAILCTINDYVVQPNGLLYRLWNKNQQRGKTTSIPQLCLPARYREAVIANTHQLGHFGAMKVMLQLREHYHWPSMHQSVLTFLEGCTVCQYANARAHKRVPLNPPDVPSGPLEDVHIDILRMSVPSHGFNYVLVMICAFSRLTRCVAVKQKTAESTANAFYHGWLAVYGAPLRLTIYSDCGMEFRGAVFQCLVKSYGLRSVLTNYYSPTTNGICERLNRTILATLRRLVDNHPQTWYAKLDACTNAVNSSTSISTHHSPFELIHGMKIRLPHQIEVPTIKADTPVTEQEAIGFWRDRLETLRDEATRIMTDAQQDQKEQYDKHTGETQLKVGDACARLVERLPVVGSKMSSRYEGHFTVERFTSSTNVELYDMDTHALHPRYLHVNKLKKIHPGRPQATDFVGLEPREGPEVAPPPVPAAPGREQAVSPYQFARLRQAVQEMRTRDRPGKKPHPTRAVHNLNETNPVDFSGTWSSGRGEEEAVQARRVPPPSCVDQSAMPTTPPSPVRASVHFEEAPAQMSAERAEEPDEVAHESESDTSARTTDPPSPYHIPPSGRVAPRSPPPQLRTPPQFKRPEADGDTDGEEDELDSTHAQGRDMSVEPDDAKYYEVAKVITKKTDKDGVLWWRVKWRYRPAKKYNEWVRRSDIQDMVDCVPVADSSQGEVVPTPLKERAQARAAVATPNPLADDTTVSPTPPGRLSSSSSDTDFQLHLPPPVETPREEDDSEIVFASPRVASPSPIEPSTPPRGTIEQESPPTTYIVTPPDGPVRTPRERVGEARTSTPTDHVSSTLEGWDVTDVLDATISPTTIAETPAMSTSSEEDTLSGITCTPIPRTDQFLSELLDFFHDAPAIQAFLKMDFTEAMANSIATAIWSNASANLNQSVTQLYPKSIHPFASFYRTEPAITACLREMGVTCTREFPTLENLFQYYKARAAGELRVALSIVAVPAKQAKAATSRGRMQLPDVATWDKVSRGTMIHSMAQSLVSRPNILTRLLSTTGSRIGLLGHDRKWCYWHEFTEPPRESMVHENRHGEAYEMLRELYLLAHLGTFSVCPYGFSDYTAASGLPEAPPSGTKLTLKEEGRQLSQEMQWLDSKIMYLLQRYRVKTIQPTLYSPRRSFPAVTSQLPMDPLSLKLKQRTLCPILA